MSFLTNRMKIYIGTDHAGFELKEKLKPFLADLGYEVEDKGAFSYNESDDYPDFVRPVAEAVASNEGSLGIVLGKSGEGEAMVTDKVKGIRTAVYYGGSLDIPRLAREHNNANILSLGAGFLTEDEAKEAVKIFIKTPFSGEERHERRVEKIEN